MKEKWPNDPDRVTKLISDFSDKGQVIIEQQFKPAIYDFCVKAHEYDTKLNGLFSKFTQDDYEV